MYSIVNTTQYTIGCVLISIMRQYIILRIYGVIHLTLIISENIYVFGNYFFYVILGGLI